MSLIYSTTILCTTMPCTPCHINLAPMKRQDIYVCFTKNCMKDDENGLEILQFEGLWLSVFFRRRHKAFCLSNTISALLHLLTSSFVSRYTRFFIYKKLEMASSSRSFLFFHVFVVPKVSYQFLKRESYERST